MSTGSILPHDDDLGQPNKSSADNYLKLSGLEGNEDMQWLYSQAGNPYADNQTDRIFPPRPDSSGQIDAESFGTQIRLTIIQACLFQSERLNLNLSDLRQAWTAGGGDGAEFDDAVLSLVAERRTMASRDCVEKRMSENSMWLRLRVTEPEAEISTELPESLEGLEAAVESVIRSCVDGDGVGVMTQLEELEEFSSNNGGEPGEVDYWIDHAIRKLMVEESDTVSQELAELAEVPVEIEEPGLSLEQRRAEAVAAIEQRQPENYWEKYPELSAISEAAERARVDRFALASRVLVYISAQLPPTVYLTDHLQSLTLYSVVIAESGAGKGVLDAVADRLVGQWPHANLTQLRPGTGNMHTLLTELGDFANPKVEVDDDGKETEIYPKPQRMLIQGNELAAWAEQQGNAEWAGVLCDVFDGEAKYHVRNQGNRYHFGRDQHSLGVTFSVQPDAARYLFDATGRGLPGRCLISALPNSTEKLPEDFDPWNLDGAEVDTFDPYLDVEPLGILPKYQQRMEPFTLSPEAKKANANLKRAWDLNHGEAGRLRSEQIFSQLPKVRLRVAVALSVMLDLAPDRVIPLEALQLADYFLQVSVENTRYARDLAMKSERRSNATAVTSRKLAEGDADLELAKTDVLAVIDGNKGKAGLSRMRDRKKKTAELHGEAISQLLAEGEIEEVVSPHGRAVSYRRK